jgi:mannose-1-phosphate guanylyltransferase
MRPVYAIVLAGGSGTRFWPASRRSLPKQLLRLAPGSSQTLIESTVRRLEPLCPPERVLVATGAHLLDVTRRALAWLPEASFLGEPVARNTAPCIGWATAKILRRDPDALIMVLPSDHHIADETAFRAALERALASASSGTITAIGIEPTRPETGYGYIESGEDVSPGVRRVVRFVEKPDRARAEEYLQSQRFLWNAGMFFFSAEIMLQAVATHLPELASGLRRIDDAAIRSAAEEQRVTEQVFNELEPISIDYGVMERVDALNVVPAAFGWSDLGSWQSAWELAPRDGAGNAADAGMVLIDARGNLVRDLSSRTDRIIALVGVEDLCVIETDDALLIIPRDRAQDVRLVVQELERRDQRERL